MFFRRPKGHDFLLRMMMPCIAACLLGFGFTVVEPAKSHAAETQVAQADIRALQQTQRALRIGIIGDSLATDLWFGMSRVLRENKRIEVSRLARPATGLIRDDVYDWHGAVKGFLAKNKFDVVAVMIGGNDRQSVYVDRKRLDRFSEPWMAEYGRRVGNFMKLVAASGARLYWVGLPPVRSGQMTGDYRRMNEVYRAQSKRHGFTYVGIWDAFSDGSGGYSSFGRTLEGQRRRLRMKDGLHFTNDGQSRLAHVVARAMSRGLSGGK